MMNDIDDMKQKLHELGDALGVARDELRVEMKLASYEIREEWEELEKEWHKFGEQMKHIKQEAVETGSDINAALSLLGEELLKSYERIKKSL
jgi:predicted  nucleic acid-binding Zn-ribbon protein